MHNRHSKSTKLRVDAAHARQLSRICMDSGWATTVVCCKAVCEWQGSMLQNLTPAAVHVLLVVTHLQLFLGRAKSF